VALQDEWMGYSVTAPLRKSHGVGLALEVDVLLVEVAVVCSAGAGRAHVLAPKRHKTERNLSCILNIETYEQSLV
jgi:hypothetical protein